MLSEKDIETCLNEHKDFLEKYIADDAMVCYALSNKIKNRHIVKLGTRDAKDKLKNHLVSPDRFSFFTSVSNKLAGIDNLKILEIGVSTGVNAKLIYDILKPKEIHLIDPWLSQNNRAADRGFTTNQHSLAFENTRRLFSKAKNVYIQQGFAEEFVEDYEDEYFDFIYVDGDHSYEGCKKDLYEWYPKLKPGGFFGGHDFTNNNNSMRNKKYGVQKAACEFLLDHDRKIEFLTPCVETKYPQLLLPFDWGFIK